MNNQAPSFFVELLVLVSVVFGLINSAKIKNDSIKISKFRPSYDNQYVCTFKKLTDGTMYLREFSPIDRNGVAHHIILYGCREPGVNAEVWACGDMKSRSDRKKNEGLVPGEICLGGEDDNILFLEAFQAGDYELPKSLSFKVGRGTPIQYLVIQVHYKMADMFRDNPDATDSSGIIFKYQKIPTKFMAGVLVLGSAGSIPSKSEAGKDTFCMDIMCSPQSMPRYQTVKPFAFRVHSHSHGRLISGFVVRNANPTERYMSYRSEGPQYANKVWMTLGVKSPQEEQTFYNVSDMLIEPSDILVARCVYETSEKEVRIGPTADDEMCNFYILYYMDGTTDARDLGQNVCFTSGQSSWKRQSLLLGKVPNWVKDLSLNTTLSGGEKLAGHDHAV